MFWDLLFCIFGVALTKNISLELNTINFKLDPKELSLFLETQKHQEAIQEKRDVPIVQVLNSAVPPPVKYAPKRKTMLIITFFLSAFIALVIIVGRAIYKGRLYIHTV